MGVPGTYFEVQPRPLRRLLSKQDALTGYRCLRKRRPLVQRRIANSIRGNPVEIYVSCWNFMCGTPCGKK